MEEKNQLSIFWYGNILVYIKKERPAPYGAGRSLHVRDRLFAYLLRVKVMVLPESTHTPSLP